MRTEQDSSTALGNTEPRSPRPWRDNIEVLTMSIVLALLLKAFIVEAYKIPTGSMQPTLMGLSAGPGVPNGLRVSDRILVDKFTPHLADPRRFEVAVFKYPLDRSKNFVKRICGMPGELFRIQNGDLWRRDNDSQPWEIIRRPDGVMRDIWKNLDLLDTTSRAWTTTSGGDGWQVEPREIVASGDGRARYGVQDAPILDRYYHGYPDSLRKQLNQLHPRETNQRVGDLRLTGKLEATAGCEEVVLELSEGTATYRFVLPGPAGVGSARVLIESTEADRQPREVSAGDVRLPANKSLRFRVHNLDDQLRFELDGDILAEVDVDPQAYPDSRIHVEQRGEGARFSDLRVQRDIHYTTGSKNAEYAIPEGHYLMLGDNTQDSSDSREWTYSRYALEDGTELQGNFRQTQNPFRDGPVTWLEDEWGERHALSVEGTPRLGSRPEGLEPLTARALTPESAPYVPRELITGRAIAVFWPVNPFKQLIRFKWIR